MISHHSFDTVHAMKYGVNEAIMLQKFIHWIGINAHSNKNFHDGRYWTYNTQNALVGFFPFWKRDSVMRYIDSLIEQGVLLKGNYNTTKMDRTTWYSFSNSFFAEIGIQIGNEEQGKNQQWNVEKPTMECGETNKVLYTVYKPLNTISSFSEKNDLTEQKQEVLFHEVLTPPKPPKPQRTTNISFQEIWNLYDKKIGGLPKLQKKWEALSDEQRALAKAHIIEYVKATPEKKFRANFETYLNQQRWTNEVISLNPQILPTNEPVQRPKAYADGSGR